jgi:hypothetical protein
MAHSRRMDGFVLEYSRIDPSAPGGQRRERYIAVAETADRAFAAAGGHWGVRQVVIESGPAVLRRAREMGIPDNQARTL